MRGGGRELGGDGQVMLVGVSGVSGTECVAVGVSSGRWSGHARGRERSFGHECVAVGVSSGAMVRSTLVGVSGVRA